MPHYYSEKQNEFYTPYRIRVRVGPLDFEIYSSKGVFSKSELDEGSRLLIEKAIVKDGDSVLDLGCGNGVVGIAVSKLHKIKLTMVDINEMAVHLARMNAKLHGVDARVVKSDVFSELKGEVFDTILLNPPQSAGRELCYRMITESKDHLKKGGSLQMVARKNKGGAMLAKKMEEVFGNIVVLGKRKGFYVWKSDKLE